VYLYFGCQMWGIIVFPVYRREKGQQNTNSRNSSKELSRRGQFQPARVWVGFRSVILMERNSA